MQLPEPFLTVEQLVYTFSLYLLTYAAIQNCSAVHASAECLYDPLEGSNGE